MRIQPILTFVAGAALFAAVVGVSTTPARPDVRPVRPRIILLHATQNLAAAGGHVVLAMAVSMALPTTWTTPQQTPPTN